MAPNQDEVTFLPARYFSKLQEFYAAEKYFDFTIHSEGRSFKCHRLVLSLACSYFDTMCSSSFKEEATDSVDLTDCMSAATVERILEHIYTGCMSITADNVCDLLQASELLDLRELHNSCVSFVRRNGPVKNMLELYLLACRRNNETLLEAMSGYVTKPLEKFFRTNEFLSLEFETFSVILKWWSCTTDDAVVQAIIRWIGHSRVTRMSQFNDIFEILEFENVSSDFIKHLVKKYASVFQPSKFGDDNDDDDDDSDDVLTCEITSLYAYVICSNEQPITAFRVNSPRSCSMLCHVTSQPADVECLRSVAVNNDRLYSLNFFFTESRQKRQDFRYYFSADMFAWVDLQPPPFLLTEFHLCHAHNDNGIYAYNDDSLGPKSSETTLIFYNLELDTWSALPNMRKRVNEACMTVFNNVVYIIGGIDTDNDDNYGKIVQTYDSRTQEWNLLPKPFGTYCRAACCARDGKIYVCAGVDDYSAERFDPVAGKWETIEPMNLDLEFHQVVPYANQLWAIGGYTDTGNDYTKGFTADVYDPRLNKWQISTLIKDATRKHDSLSFIKDAVVFK